MAKLLGQEISVTATVSKVALSDSSVKFSLVNDGTTNSAYYRADPDPAALTFQGDAATLKARGGAELKTGEAACLGAGVSVVEISCATALTTTVRVVPGEMATTISAIVKADIVTADVEAITGASPNNKTLNDVNTTATSIKSAVEAMDDWDESDRAKVNVVAGQAGIPVGAGVVATAPRVTLGSDDPLVAQGVIGTARTAFSAVINAAAGAQTPIQAAPAAGHQLWIYGYHAHAGVAAGTFVLQSANTAKTGVCPVGVNGGVSAESSLLDCPIIKCATAEAFNVTTVTCELDGVAWGFDVTL